MRIELRVMVWEEEDDTGTAILDWDSVTGRVTCSDVPDDINIRASHFISELRGCLAVRKPKAPDATPPSTP